MPQIFQVLCCYNCEMFQVHQVKKSNKWQCRVCNEKQSLKKAFKIGSAKDCRFLVQELNMQKSGHVAGENEDLEISENNDNISERETQTSELLDFTEKEIFSNSFVEDGGNAHGTWLKEANNINYSSCCSNSISIPCKENIVIDENDSLSENSRMDQIAHITSDCSDELSIMDEDNNQFKLAVCEKVSKHSPVTRIKALSQDVTPPPLKKNRGFQIILNAASKLN